jgi:hypothetical protein
VRIGDKRVRLRLKGGVRYDRQLDAMRKIISGQAIRGELNLLRRGSDIICSAVTWLPRPARQEERTGVLTVRTSTDSLIVAFNAKDERLWIYNGDQLRRWQAEHQRQLQRWAEDTKAEHRPIAPFAERRADAVRKYRNRLATACHEVASLIVNYAARRRFAAVFYDDSVHTYCEAFPWFELKSKIIQKCDAAGVLFEDTCRVPIPRERRNNTYREERTVTSATG